MAVTEIHKLPDGTCVISENEVWRPGCFENEEAARIGLGLDDETILRLQTAVGPEAITLAAVKAVRA